MSRPSTPDADILRAPRAQLGAGAACAGDCASVLVRGELAGPEGGAEPAPACAAGAGAAARGCQRLHRIAVGIIAEAGGHDGAIALGARR